MSTANNPLISICIPTWQVKQLMVPCLRSIRKYSSQYNIEVIIVDNGSKDDSLDYLRSLDWITLIERPEESNDNWPTNVFTGWDVGLQVARGDYYITMHSDVFIKNDNWLRPFLNRMQESPQVAAVGAWKLNLEHPFYLWQKDFFGRMLKRFKGDKQGVSHQYGLFPRDYCAMYRRQPIIDNQLSFAKPAEFGGGYQIIKQLWDLNYESRMIPIPELAKHIVHIAHGTAAVAAEARLRREKAQRKVEGKVERLFNESWVQQLFTEEALDQ